MKNLITLILFFIGIWNISLAQEDCLQLGEINEAQLIEFKRSHFDLQKSIDECHNYPVTVFILHVGEEIGTGYNLSDNQVQSAIESLNVYWHNDSIYQVDTAVAFPHTFPLAEIVRINLAEYFPDYATEGISTNTSPNWAGQGVSCGQIWSLIESLGYDRQSNFHIYSYNYVGNILGFAWLTQMDRGAWVRFNRFGDFNWEADGEQFIGNPNNKTTVHEVGHVFGLRHTFDNTNSDCTPVQDESNCLFVNDRVCDTPVQTVTWGCGPTCGENPRNHMGYRSCRNQFTQGQLERALLVEASPNNGFENFKRCDECIVDLENYGDFNEDGSIGIEDFSQFSAAYGVDSLYTPELDANCDGVIDIQDYSTFASNFGAEFFVNHLRGDFNLDGFRNYSDKLDIYNHLGYSIDGDSFGILYDLVIDGNITWQDYDAFKELYLPSIDQCGLGFIEGKTLVFPENLLMINIHTNNGTTMFYEWNFVDEYIVINQPGLYYIKIETESLQCSFSWLVL